VRAATVTLAVCMLAIWHCGEARGASKRPLGLSELPAETRAAAARRVAPPPLAEREAPYSTPMYYLLTKGFADGPNNELKLDRNRPDWQEVIIRDWAELGLTSSLYCTGPTEWSNPEAVNAVLDYCDLSKKYGMKVGIRMAGDGQFQGIDSGGWDVHPRNPKNRMTEYVAWTGKMAAVLKGRVEYYVLGDELNGRGWEVRDTDGKTKPQSATDETRWRPEDYMAIFRQVSKAIKSADADAKVSMMGMNGLDWPYMEALLKLGYAEYGDAVAANPDDHKYPFDAIHDFVGKVRKANPKFKLYSNGVGYVAAKDAVPYPPNAEHWKFRTDQAQADRIAQMMVSMFDVAWDRTPYYIVLRQWVLPDSKIAPHWYGIFGICDLVVNADDTLSVKRHAAWHALQTVAHVFHSRSKTSYASFKPELSQTVDHLVAYERGNYECLLVMWNREGDKPAVTSIRIPAVKYSYPVQVPLTDYRRATDVPYRIEGDTLVIPNVTVGTGPVIIRLVAEKQQFSN
jgi:hypothetical protein